LIQNKARKKKATLLMPLLGQLEEGALLFKVVFQHQLIEERPHLLHQKIRWEC